MPQMNILIKPASGSCNMRCKYCFYADETKKRDAASYGAMSMATAENLVRRAMESAEEECVFGFQGGEPTLRGLDFFRDFVALVRKYDAGRAKVSFSIQTNGLLLDEQWAAFLKENDFLVGLSMDGDRQTHDLNRVDVNGAGTFSRVLRAARLLEKAAVPFNILTVVNSRVARSVDSVYSFYKKNGLLYQQYIPCLDPIFEERGGSSWSLTPEAYGQFLIRLFDRWYADRMRGEPVYVHYFECLAGMLQGYPPASCGMTGVCSVQTVVEADGSVYPCDFYALDDYRLGNVNTDSFDEMHQKRLPFLEQSRQGLEKCAACRHGGICRGGCRRDRQGPEGIGENYFCQAYMRFFDHAAPKLYALVRAQGRM